MRKQPGKSAKPAWRKPKHKRGASKAIGPVQTLDIAYIGHRGEGVAWVDQDGQKIRCYIPYTAAGDTVTARVNGERGELVAVTGSGEDRSEPFCPHFGSCGGCALQHVQASAYAKWKQGVVETALERQSLSTTIHPIVDAHGSGRRRVTVHVRSSKQGIEAGFMRVKSHDLLTIDACPILAPELSGCFQVATRLGEILKSNCNKMDIQMAASAAGLDCNIIGPRDITYDQHMDLTDLAHAENFARLAVNDDVVLEQRPPVLRMGTADARISSGTFLQATEMGEETLSKLVRDCVGDAKMVADLFLRGRAVCLTLGRPRQHLCGRQ